MPKKNPDFNKRLLSSSDIKRRRKRGEAFLMDSFQIEEVLDESGEVKEDTVIRFSFGGLLIYMSVPNAFKFNKELNDVLNLKKR